MSVRPPGASAITHGVRSPARALTWRAASSRAPAIAASAATHDRPAKATVEGSPSRISPPPAAGNSGKNGYSQMQPPLSTLYQWRAITRNQPPSIASSQWGWNP